MRGSTLMALALGLPGCSMPNPGFGVSGGAASSGAVDTSTSGAASDTPDPVTGTLDSTTDASQTAAATTEADTSTSTSTSTSTTQTSDPVMTSGSGSSETGDPPQCPVINDALGLDVAVNGQPIVECDEEGFFIEGILFIGSTLELVTDVNCGGMDPPKQLSMGHGFPLVDAVYPGCVTVYGAWNHAVKGCQLGLLTVIPVDFPEAFVILASFSMPVPAMYPLQPKPILTDECGCPGDLPGCCPELDAGQLALEPTNGSGPVEQGNSTLITANSQQFNFYNLESWVGPECTDGPGAGRNIDWIAVSAK